MSVFDKLFKQFEALIDDGLKVPNALKAISLLGIPAFDKMGEEDAVEALKSYKLWSDTMPMGDIDPYSEEQRDLHILWELLDRSPYAVNCDFAVPLRQKIALRLFKRCGEGFVANEGCRFNYGHRIEVGDNVSWNASCYIDSKGTVKFGDFAMLTEYVKIFTHSHSEHDHMERTYAPVVIGEYAKVYTNATILPGVTLGRGAIVATGAIVTKSVDEFTLVGGVPAKPMRKRNFYGDDLSEMNQYMMKDGMYQKR